MRRDARALTRNESRPQAQSGMAEETQVSKNTPAVLSEDEIQARLERDLPAWTYSDNWIRRTFKTGGWPYTLMVVNAIGYRAEAAFHHPDLAVSWGHVTVKLQTHSAGGITEMDLALASDIEELATWLPGDNSPFDGFEKGMKKKWVR